MPGTAPTPVLCVETGEVFKSAREAARKKGISTHRNIYRAVQQNYMCGGLHWIYADEEQNDRDRTRLTDL
eukprot:g32975.t1